jgi:methyl-accepting chemotaxis protein
MASLIVTGVSTYVITKINVTKDFKNLSSETLSMVAERSAAATEEVSASVENQSNSNEDMQKLAFGLNDKAERLRAILESFRF